MEYDSELSVFPVSVNESDYELSAYPESIHDSVSELSACLVSPNEPDVESIVCFNPLNNSDVVLCACPVSVYAMFVNSVPDNALGLEHSVHPISANASCSGLSAYLVSINKPDFESSASPVLVSKSNVEPSVCPMSSKMFQLSVCQGVWSQGV